MEERAETAAEEILRAVDEASDPSKMSKPEARDFYAEIVDELKIRINALGLEEDETG